LGKGELRGGGKKKRRFHGQEKEKKSALMGDGMEKSLSRQSPPKAMYRRCAVRIDTTVPRGGKSSREASSFAYGKKSTALDKRAAHRGADWGGGEMNSGRHGKRRGGGEVPASGTLTMKDGEKRASPREYCGS